MPGPRRAQLAYSESQALMSDEASRRKKGRKIAAVLQHFLGRDDLDGLRVLDVGCSTGIIADELRLAGATVIGGDIDRPGLAGAQNRFGDCASFVLADSERLPIRDDSVDAVVCNHVYEHVVDADRLIAEIRRVVRRGGVMYLGLGNRLGVMEPHYRLPFLSWLPRPIAHLYVRASGRAEHYHEQFLTRRGLRALCRGLHVWDYTEAVLAEPARFGASDEVPRWFRRLPEPVVRAALVLAPTYLWVATTEAGTPAGHSTSAPVRRVPT